MKELNYIIISPEMVWQWYYGPCKEKNFRELLGGDARAFIKILKTRDEIFIEDILPLTAVLKHNEK
jgi:hypothetical protein